MARLQKAIALSAVAVASRGVLGFTVDPFTGYQPRVGYAVGVGLEQRYPSHPSAAELRHYIRRNQHALLNHHCYLGGWQADDGEYCLDVSRVFPPGDLGERLAVQFGRAIGEESYANLANGKCTPL